MTDYLLKLRYPRDRSDIGEQIDALLYALDSGGSSSVTEGESEVVTTFLATAEARREAAEAFRGIEGCAVESVDAESVDWLEQYQQSLAALEIGERFVVAPDESLITDRTRLAIVIPQEQAFGTGSHESTALCLELLESIDCSGLSGIDVGTGSGILAIGMRRLGADPVFAFDNDFYDTFGIVNRNLRRNSLSPEDVKVFFGTLEAVRPRPFDVIMMNILAEVVIELLPSAKARISAGGSVIVSGILTSQRDDVVRAAEAAGFQLGAERSRGEWWGGLLRGGGAAADLRVLQSGAREEMKNEK